MLVLPALLLTFFLIKQRVSSAIALIVSLTLGFFSYELSLFVIPIISINVFASIASNFIQIIPIIVGLVVFAKTPKIDEEEKGTNGCFPLGREILNLFPTLTVLTVIFMSFIRFGWGSMAFAMNGDSRNHVWFSRFMIEQQGLDASSAAYYPVLPDGMVALTRSGLNFIADRAGNPLTLDVVSIGIMTATVIILMSLVHVQIGKSIFKKEHPLKDMSIAVIAFLPLGGLVSKVALSDGFYPALFASLTLQLFIFAGWLYLRTNTESEKTFLLVSLFLLTPLIVSTWTLLAIIPAASFLFLPYRVKKTIVTMVRNQRPIQISILFSVFLNYVNLVPLIGKGAASNYVKSPGAITLPPSNLMLGILIAFLIYLAWRAYRDSAQDMRHLASIIFIILFSFLFLASLQDNGNYWNYYPAKFTWIALISIFPFLFGIGIQEFSKNPRVLTIIMIPTLVLSSWSITSSPWIKFDLLNSMKPQSIIYEGWYSPGSDSVNLVLDYGKKGVPVVFWDLSDPSGDRLANFWLATYLPARFDNPVLATNELRDWAYWEIPGETASLCDLLVNSDLQWKVVTRNKSIRSQVLGVCGQEISLNEFVVLGS
jgi:hypothetical protein